MAPIHKSIHKNSVSTKELLEQQVQSRTLELERINIQLQAEVVEHQRITKELQQRLRLENIVTTLAKQFVNTSSTQSGPIINNALYLIGDYLQVDRAYLFCYHDDGITMSNTHEWCATGVEPEIQNLQHVPFNESVPWWHQCMVARATIQLNRLEELLPDAPLEYDFLKVQGIKSLLVVPVATEQTLWGFVGFDIVYEYRSWLNSDVNLLNLWAEVLVGAMERWRNEETIYNLNRTLEQRVRERTHEVSDLYNNAPCGYHSLNRHGIYLHINQTQLNWLGYTAEDLINHRSFRELLTPQSQISFDNVFHNLVSGNSREINDIELDLCCKDGSILPVSWSSTALFDSQGDFVMTRATLFDITERRQTELTLRSSRDELHAANAALARASQLKDEFLASMSHELRTPLTGILSLSEALQEQVYGSFNERQLHALQSIEQSGQHLLELINDILDLSKIEAGQLELTMEYCSVFETCQSSLHLVRSMAQRKQQTLSLTLSETNREIYADPRRLKQMLVNLLSNAIKFTPNKGKIGLKVDFDEDKGEVALCVTDTGVGIAHEDLAKLFRPFTQLDSRLSRQHSGTGLGLSLVQRMAELHGGSVGVESDVNVGSRFTVRLPWRAKNTQHTSIPAGTDTSSLVGTALTVEDMAVDAEQISRYFAKLGIRNYTWASGSGVVEYVTKLKPSIVLLDLHLPGKSGWAVLNELKSDPRTTAVPVIIISVEENRAKATLLGAAGYLIKPFRLIDLSNEVNRVMSQQSADRSILMVSDSSNAPRVLIAEDTETTINVLNDYLTSKGYRINIARNGQQALDMLHTLYPDVALMDIQMPIMDGLEVIRRVRNSTDPRLKRLRIIAVTALAMLGDRERCLQLGANDYISKPIHLRELVQLIDRQILIAKNQNLDDQSKH